MDLGYIALIDGTVTFASSCRVTETTMVGLGCQNAPQVVSLIRPWLVVVRVCSAQPSPFPGPHPFT